MATRPLRDGMTSPLHRNGEPYPRQAYSTTTGTTYGEFVPDTALQDDLPAAPGSPWEAWNADVEEFRMVGGWPLGTMHNKHVDFGKFSGGPVSGIGPASQSRPDKRIHEDVVERLAMHTYVDSDDIEVDVEEGVVTLRGVVPDAQVSHLAQDVAFRVRGVQRVRNELRTRQAASGASQEHVPQHR